MAHTDAYKLTLVARRSAHLGYAHSIYIYIEKSLSPASPSPSQSRSRSRYINERSCETYANCISVSAQKLDTKHSAAGEESREQQQKRHQRLKVCNANAPCSKKL